MMEKIITIKQTEKGTQMDSGGFSNSEVIGLLDTYKALLIQREIEKFKRKRTKTK